MIHHSPPIRSIINLTKQPYAVATAVITNMTGISTDIIALMNTSIVFNVSISSFLSLINNYNIRVKNNHERGLTRDDMIGFIPLNAMNRINHIIKSRDHSFPEQPRDL